MLTHIDQNHLPTMVDVTNKNTSVRMASAQTLLQLPSEMKAFIQGEELHLKKGPVFQTAIIAGTMAVKRTHEMIPFCHQIPIESCKIKIEMNADLLVTITCQVKTTYKTGVEMEALHGANIAALTIYDMCKAVSHQIEIKETKLMQKTGGKRTILKRPTYGLVLTGGKSERMKEDKALISYHGKPHAEYIQQVLNDFCGKVFLSSRKDQWKGSALENIPAIYDEGNGPLEALTTAFKTHPDVNWIVVACDLVHFNHKTVEKLLAHANEEALATCYKNNEKGFPEALCAFYTPLAHSHFEEALKNDIRCPVKVLRNAPVDLIDQEEGINLANINTKEEFQQVLNEIH